MGGPTPAYSKGILFWAHQSLTILQKPLLLDCPHRDLSYSLGARPEQLKGSSCSHSWGGALPFIVHTMLATPHLPRPLPAGYLATWRS